MIFTYVVHCATSFSGSSLESWQITCSKNVFSRTESDFQYGSNTLCIFFDMHLTISCFLTMYLPKRKDIYCFSDLVSWCGREVKWVTNLDHALPLSYFCIRGRFLLKSQRFWSQIYRANTNWICRPSSPLPNQTHFLGCTAAVAAQLKDPCFPATSGR